MKRITILAAAGALFAPSAIGSTPAFAATNHSPAAHIKVPAQHGGHPGPVVTCRPVFRYHLVSSRPSAAGPAAGASWRW